jgi:hypothetical protein
MQEDNRTKNKNSNITTVAAVAIVSIFIIALIIGFSIGRNNEESQYKPLNQSGNAGKTEESTRPAPVLEGYAFDVGSMWIYETLDNTLTVKVTDRYEENGQAVYIYSFYYGDKKIAEEHRVFTDEYQAKIKSVQGDSTITVYKEPLILYRFPLKVGDRWTNKFELNGVEFISDVEVVSYEKVKTKGGVFMAYKIKHSTYPKDSKKDAIVDADWYNPRIGLIAYAKKDGENPKALVKYSVKLIEK